MPDRTLVDDWLHVHDLLLEKERAFTQVALRAAAGAISPEELDGERAALMALRALCTAVYEKAFPQPPGARSGKGASSVVPYIAQGELQKARGTEAPQTGTDEDSR